MFLEIKFYNVYLIKELICIIIIFIILLTLFNILILIKIKYIYIKNFLILL